MENRAKKTYIDLFAGCGGLSLGLHYAGWKGIFAIEKSPLAFETLRHNLINKKNHFDWPEWLPKAHHDIDEVLENYKEELKDMAGKVDLVAGGPPCQGFSSAGRRKEDDERNNLIKSYLRFIFTVKPKIIFFENVKGFTLNFKKNKSKGLAYSYFVSRALSLAGYHVYGKLIDFSEFGIPQKRTRFILVGIKKEINNDGSKVKEFFNLLMKRRESFLANRGLSITTTLEEAISDLLQDEKELPSPDTVGFKTSCYGEPKSLYQLFLREGVNKGIPDSHRFANHSRVVTEKFLNIIKSQGDYSKIKQQYRNKKRIQILLKKDQQSPTLTTLPDDYVHYHDPRILTVREYARIQSFPDWYEFKGKYTTGGKERTKEVPRYSQIGNAIPPLFSEQSGVILKELLANPEISSLL